MVAASSDLLKTIRRFASEFDPAVISTAQLRHVINLCCSAIAILETIKAKASAHLAERDPWKQEGYRSFADSLATKTGTSVGTAKSAIDTGRRLQDQPLVEEAALSGEISFEKVSLIADAVEADPRCARRLVAKAKSASVRDLRDEAGRIKAEACSDLEARERKIHTQRSLREWVDPEGAWNLRAKGTKTDGAQFMAAVKEISDEQFLGGDSEARKERPDARDFDAAVELAKRYTSALSEVRAKPNTKNSSASSNTSNASTGRCRTGAPVKILVRVDYDTFIRGYPRKGETCELAGYGPVPVSVVNELIENGDPFVAAIMTKGQTLAGVAHLGRKPNSYQRSALEWLYPTCAIDGCRQSAHLEADHTVDWSKTHFTILDFLDFKCPHHHRLKTTADWDFIKGTREFVPPEDPRHPRHKRKQE